MRRRAVHRKRAAQIKLLTLIRMILESNTVDTEKERKKENGIRAACNWISSVCNAEQTQVINGVDNTITLFAMRPSRLARRRKVIEFSHLHSLPSMQMPCTFYFRKNFRVAVSAMCVSDTRPF